MYNFEILDPTSFHFMADWVELFITSNQRSIAKAEIKTVLNNVTAKEPSDDYIANLWGELIRREKLYGDNPPFIVNQGNIENNLDWKTQPFYLTCLILSIFGNRTIILETAQLFERISNEAIKNYFQGESFIFGFPSPLRLQEIAPRMSETFVSEPPAHYKDRGVDLISWKPFKDDRPSQIVVLTQCASGKQWREKLSGIVIRSWNQYIHWRTEPILAFTLPQMISNDPDVFEEYSNAGGILFDRARIYRNLHNQNINDSQLNQNLLDWCETRLSEEMITLEGVG